MRPDQPLTNMHILHRPEGGICADSIGRGPTEYARQIARYIRDPSKVRANTMNEWGRAPSLAKCAALINAAGQDREAFRAESERLGESDRDAVDWRPAPTSLALDMQRVSDENAANVILLPQNDDLQLIGKPSFRFIDELVESIAKAMRVTLADITGPSRFGPQMRARQVVCWVLHKRGQSYSQIGRRLNRDHTSIMNAVDRFESHATDRMRLIAEHFAGIFDEVAA